MTSVARPSGRAGRRAARDSGALNDMPPQAGPESCARRKGGCPLSSSYRTTAERVEIGPMVNGRGLRSPASGDMYAGVPTASTRGGERTGSHGRRIHHRFGHAEVRDLARCRPVSSTFSGLTSRCTTPLLVRVSQGGRESRAATSRLLPTGSSPPAREPIAQRFASPRTASCSRAARPASPVPSSGTMCGCCNRAASEISR
jgi:hypothetical protein